MTDETANPVFERGGGCCLRRRPFKGEEAARPWLILSNHEGRPFHGEQYIAVTLTSKSWLDGLIAIPEESWLRGGTPAESRVVPWGVQSIDHPDIGFWQGRLEEPLVEEVGESIVEELQ